MKFWRICIVAVVLLAAGLACGFPFDDEKPPVKPDVDNPAPKDDISMEIGPLSVDPSTGYGSFSLGVHYKPYDESGKQILCRYQNNKGSQSRPLEEIKGFTGEGQSNWWDHYAKITFNVTEPGQYTVTCESESGKSVATTGFTVTEKPAPKPPEPPAKPDQTRRFFGDGTGLVYSGEPNEYYKGYCEAHQDVTLTIKADGSAVLNVTGPMYSNLTECTQVGGSSVMGWDIIGTLVQKDAEKVSFTSCNEGGFDATGEVSFSGGIIAGTVICMWNSGSDAGKKKFEISMP